MAVRLWEWLSSTDPTPWFVTSLLPYLAFLHWAGSIRGFPPLARTGFQLTLLFVAVTIAAAVIAQQRYGELLANVDGLHGGAEAFLTLSNLLVLLGFATAAEARASKARSLEARSSEADDRDASDQQVLRGQTADPGDPEDGSSAPDP